MAEIDKFSLLGKIADLTQERDAIDQQRDNLAHLAANQGATATELAAVLAISRQTAHRRYLAH